MALSFEDEIRAFIKHTAEQNPHLHALQSGQKTRVDLGVQDALEMLGNLGAMHTAIAIKIAQEIDKLRAAINGG
jgi:hypothetical protein